MEPQGSLQAAKTCLHNMLSTVSPSLSQLTACIEGRKGLTGVFPCGMYIYNKGGKATPRYFPQVVCNFRSNRRRNQFKNMQITYKLQFSLSKTAKQMVLFTVHDFHCSTKLKPNRPLNSLLCVTTARVTIATHQMLSWEHLPRSLVCCFYVCGAMLLPYFYLCIQWQQSYNKPIRVHSTQASKEMSI